MNPFEPYLPLYLKGTLPERPTWRHDVLACTFHRVDGVRLHTSEIPLSMGFPAGLLAFDLANPLPVPPPLVGQVWWVDDQHDMIVTVTPASFGPTMPGLRLQWGSGDRTSVVLAEWPIDPLVLVAGPTRYGRDCPWHPADWRAP